MKEELFRKKSLDRIKSPESLDEYIRVSNPGVWLLIASAIILLVGACIWGIFGHIDRTVDSNVRAEKGTLVCYIDDSEIGSVKVGMTVKFDGFEATVSEIGQKENVGYSCLLKTDAQVPDGIYDGKIVTESIKPISFVFN